jgi:hypothetical protein
MAAPVGRPALPLVSLALAVAAGVLVLAGLVIAMTGPFIGLISPNAGLATSSVLIIGLGLSPFFAIAAIVVGHISRRRHPRAEWGSVGLAFGYVILGMLVLIIAGGLAAWFSINARQA